MSNLFPSIYVNWANLRQYIFYMDLCGVCVDNQGTKNHVKIGTLQVVLWKVHLDTRLHYHQSSNFKMGKNRKCIFPRHEMNPSLLVTRRFVGSNKNSPDLRPMSEAQVRALAWWRGKWTRGRWAEDCRGGQGREGQGRKWVDASSTLTQVSAANPNLTLHVSILSIFYSWIRRLIFCR